MFVCKKNQTIKDFVASTDDTTVMDGIVKQPLMPLSPKKYKKILKHLSFDSPSLNFYQSCFVGKAGTAFFLKIAEQVGNVRSVVQCRSDCNSYLIIMLCLFNRIVHRFSPRGRIKS